MTDLTVPPLSLEIHADPITVLIREAHERRQRRWRRIGLSLVVVVVAATTAALGLKGTPPFSRTANSEPGRFIPAEIIAPTPEPAGWSVSYPIKVPSKYPGLLGEAADPRTGNFWFVAANTQHRRTPNALFEWNRRTGHLVQFPTTINFGVATPFQTPMTVTPNGDVWIGFRDTVIDFNPKTKRSTSLVLPPVRYVVVPPGEPYTVAKPNLVTNNGDRVISLAASNTGEIVVGRGYSQSIEIINTNTRTVRSVMVPPNTVVGHGAGESEVAIDESGQDIATVLVAEGAAIGTPASMVHELGQYVAGHWYVSDARCQAWSVSVTGEIMVAADIDGCVARGTIVPGSGPVTLTYPPKPEEHTDALAIALEDSTLLAQTRTGLKGYVGTRLTPTIQLGLTRNDFLSIGPGPRVVCSAQKKCRPVTSNIPIPRYISVGPQVMIWGGGNRIWFIPFLVQGTIGLIVQHPLNGNSELER